MPTNIRGDLKKYRAQKNTMMVIVEENNNFDEIIKQPHQEQPNNNEMFFPSLSSSDPNISKIITPYKRVIYFEGCDHKEFTYMKNIEADKWYFCSTCVLFRKISNINY
jgi:hypothetical protein